MTAVQPTLLRTLALILCLIGLFLSVASPIIVWRAMEGMRNDLERTILATNDPKKIAAFETALQADRQFMVVLLGLTSLGAAALFISAGVLVFRKPSQKTNTNSN